MVEQAQQELDDCASRHQLLLFDASTGMSVSQHGVILPCAYVLKQQQTCKLLPVCAKPHDA
jgi:hypothetical protein